MKRTSLRSAETLISEYTSDDVIMASNFFVKDDYNTAFDRCMGQQALRTAEFYNSNEFTQSMNYFDGAQTSKFYQDPLEMWVPLQFSICRESGQALLNDLIPNTQRTIDIDLAPLSEILRAHTQAGDPDQVGGGDQTDLPFARLPIEMALYVNNLYVNPEIHDVFASRIGFQLIRVWRRQVTPLQQPSNKVLLDQLKFPAEFLIVGVRSKENATDFDDWIFMGRRIPKPIERALLFPAAVWNPFAPGGGVAEVVIRTGAEASTLTPIVERIGVVAHGTTIYPEISTVFYNAYTPMRYLQNSLVVAPDDTSCWFVPFCLAPGQYSPTGYYNLSTGREMYVSYSGGQISPAAPAEMVVMMSALNFLLRKGDSCYLRYAL